MSSIKGPFTFLDYPHPIDVVDKGNGYGQLSLPIWHPAVFWPNNTILIADLSQINNLDIACKDPANIDAAVEYKRDIELFKRRNLDLLKIHLEVGECCICFEDITIDQPKKFTCYNKHWVCYNCSKNVTKCPLCRWCNF